MKVVVNLNEQAVELDPNTLFFVPFPKKVEEYHEKALLEVLAINLGLNPRAYYIFTDKTRQEKVKKIFVVPKKVN